MGDAVITDGLGKRFGRNQALDGFDLAVPEDTVCALLGPNGAGRTTAVRMLATLLRADAGRAEVAGHDVAREPARVRRNIGLTGQQATVDDILTGRENLVMWGRLFHLSPHAAPAVGLLLLLRFAMIWVGSYLGLIVSQEAAGAAWALLFPLSMISNMFISPSQMPARLGTVAEWNPLSATVAATRQLFGNTVPELVGESWAAQNAMLLAVAWPVLIGAVLLPLAVRRDNSVSR
jgi:ABC transporter